MIGKISPEQILGLAPADPMVQGFLLETGGRIVASEPEEPNDEGRIYVSNPQAGISLLARPEGVTSVFLHSQGLEEAEEYSRPLPRGLSFEMGREAVRRTLGEPAAQSDGGSFLGERTLPWDKFDFGDWQLHVEYPEGMAKIRRVTVMRSR